MPERSKVKGVSWPSRMRIWHGAKGPFTKNPSNVEETERKVDQMDLLKRTKTARETDPEEDTDRKSQWRGEVYLYII